MGTSLIELLVVIVVFMVGILAIIQIFPKGFQLLVGSRNNSEAEALGRDQVEILKSEPDQIPDQILAVRYVSGTPVADPTRNIFDLSLQTDGVSTDVDTVTQMGLLVEGSTTVGDWKLYSGPNSFRRIIGEGHRVPAPRQVGTYFGGLRMLAFGPVDPVAPLVAYANDLIKEPTLPRNLTQATVTTAPTVTIGATSVPVTLYNTTDSLSTSEYFVDQAGTANAVLYLPNLPAFTNTTSSYQFRTYHISLTAYVGTTSGYTRVSYPDLSITVPTGLLDSSGNLPPLIQVPIGVGPSNNGLLYNTPGALGSGQTMASVEYDTIRVQPQYYTIPNATVFGSDPFQYKILDPNIGVLLFNPIAYQTYIENPGGAREPLIAKVNYDTLDWRILRQDFHVDSQLGLNGGDYAQFQLSLPGILVGTSNGPDGLPNGGLTSLETPLPSQGASTPYATTQAALADNLMLIDLATGGVICEVDPNIVNSQLVTINKSQGLITIQGATTGGSGLSGYELLPGTTTPVNVDLTGKELRVLYRARNNWAAFPTKAASEYSLTAMQSISSSTPPTEGQAFFQVTSANVATGTRIYFPPSDLHQKVTIDQIFYQWGDNSLHELDSQDFAIEYPTTNNIGLPCIDVHDVDGQATQLINTSGTVAKNVKGASLTFQVIWNPDSFTFSSDVNGNVLAINNWLHGWRRAETQTYLQTENIQ